MCIRDSDNGVDEGGQDDRVDDVRVEGHALGDGPGHDGGGGGGEGPLEQPTRVGVSVGEGAVDFESLALEGEGVSADEASCFCNSRVEKIVWFYCCSAEGATLPTRSSECAIVMQLKKKITGHRIRTV